MTPTAALLHMALSRPLVVAIVLNYPCGKARNPDPGSRRWPCIVCSTIATRKTQNEVA